MKENYIEFRIYLKDDAVDVELNAEAASELHDKITDYVSESNDCAPQIFTQDVTYEVKYG